MLRGHVNKKKFQKSKKTLEVGGWVKWPIGNKKKLENIHVNIIIDMHPVDATGEGWVGGVYHYMLTQLVHPHTNAYIIQPYMIVKTSKCLEYCIHFFYNGTRYH